MLLVAVAVGAVPARAQLEDASTAAATLVVRLDQTVALEILDVEQSSFTLGLAEADRGPAMIGDVHLAARGLCDYTVLVSATLDRRSVPAGVFGARVALPLAAGARSWDVLLASEPNPLFAHPADWPLATLFRVEVSCDLSRGGLAPGSHTLELAFAILEDE